MPLSMVLRAKRLNRCLRGYSNLAGSTGIISASNFQSKRGSKAYIQLQGMLATDAAPSQFFVTLLPGRHHIEAGMVQYYNLASQPRHPMAQPKVALGARGLPLSKFFRAGLRPEGNAVDSHSRKQEVIRAHVTIQESLDGGRGPRGPARRQRNNHSSIQLSPWTEFFLGQRGSVPGPATNRKACLQRSEFLQGQRRM